MMHMLPATLAHDWAEAITNTNNGYSRGISGTFGELVFKLQSKEKLDLRAQLKIYCVDKGNPVGSSPREVKFSLAEQKSNHKIEMVPNKAIPLGRGNKVVFKVGLIGKHVDQAPGFPALDTQLFFFAVDVDGGSQIMDTARTFEVVSSNFKQKKLMEKENFSQETCCGEKRRRKSKGHPNKKRKGVLTKEISQQTFTLIMSPISQPSTNCPAMGIESQNYYQPRQEIASSSATSTFMSYYDACDVFLDRTLDNMYPDLEVALDLVEDEELFRNIALMENAVHCDAIPFPNATAPQLNFDTLPVQQFTYQASHAEASDPECQPYSPHQALQCDEHAPFTYTELAFLDFPAHDMTS